MQRQGTAPAPRLRADEVHVWWAALDHPEDVVRAWRGLLSADEAARADRFHFPRDRGRFIAGRAVLRILLSGYLHCDPAGLRFGYNAHGKPALAGAEGLEFNLAHSHGLALYAVTSGRAVGIDVEHIREDLAGAEIAERFFSRAENAVLRDLPAGQRREAFFRCWTRKEAYLKATGRGLSVALDSFDVSLAPTAAPALLAVRDDPGEVKRWCFRNVDPAPGYVGAVAVEGHGWALTSGPWRAAGSQ
jgi:4'-phosphopantetheinyl transferase